jgi:putative addiction module component (TIGR02574 family)
MISATIEEAVFQLPEDERAQLAHRLLMSLDTQTEVEIAEAWRNEAKQRADDIDRGVASLVSAESVRAAAQELLR